MCWNALNPPAPGCRKCRGGCVAVPPNLTVVAPATDNPALNLNYAGWFMLFHLGDNYASQDDSIEIGSVWQSVERQTTQFLTVEDIFGDPTGLVGTVYHDAPWKLFVKNGVWTLRTGSYWFVVIDGGTAVEVQVAAEYEALNYFHCLRPNTMVYKRTIWIPDVPQITGYPHHPYGEPGTSIQLSPYWP